MRRTKEEILAEKTKKDAIKAWEKKMEDYGFEMEIKNGVFIISCKYHTSTEIQEEWRKEFDRHERLVRHELNKRIPNCIFISQIAIQHYHIQRELYIKADYDYMINIPNDIWLGLRDFAFCPF